MDASPELLESIINGNDDDEVFERISEDGFDQDDLDKDDPLGDIDALLRESVASTEKRSPLTAAVRVRPPVVDDFIRNFFMKHGLKRSLDAFQNEWYGMQLSGKLDATAMDDAVPDL
ncbi:WD repeat pf20, putative [Perkinsus marinus ATCC 50983]|uniref:WD repeat pf20, putative n=1 Tax=Perkinsus marinus (strain ATCC 50983 / TXsc) TaxID=423536 RepID=C5LJ08_PERM5|nr:WD repeat pf20, putative [Perkinsus marinus ATCC 50983]EER03343.1 WD repeat pf20, putative [Perkinsus marinus ATCC 50983]|eukprot:XP_002771527.1 WD repeat pf20, putative [Perkinsus marinus ATCC 50983]